MIWFLVSRLASRPVLSVQFLRLVRFPRIGLRTGWRCAPFLSARFPHSLRSSSLVSVRHPLAAGLFSFRLVSLLVCPSRGASRRYSLQLVSCPVLLINSPGVASPVSSGGSSFRLARRSSVFRLVRFISPRLVFSSHLGVSLSSPYSRFAWRLVSAARRASRVLRLSSHSFRSRLLSRSLRLMDMGDGGGSSFSSRCGVFPSRCPVVGIGLSDDGDGMGVRFDDTRDAPFYSAHFPIR